MEVIDGGRRGYKSYFTRRLESDIYLIATLKQGLTSLNGFFEWKNKNNRWVSFTYDQTERRTNLYG